MWVFGTSCGLLELGLAKDFAKTILCRFWVLVEPWLLGLVSGIEGLGFLWNLGVSHKGLRLYRQALRGVVCLDV